MGNRVRTERSNLVISDVRPSDDGRYVCQASNVLGVRRSRPAKLVVLVRPFFVLRPSPGRGLAGGSLLLPCRVGGSPRPRVHWRRTDGPLPVGRLHYTEDNSMRIDGLRSSDAGQYSCEAENEAGRVSAAVTVEVQVAPSVDMPRRAAVTLGSQVALKCQVRGQPAPRAVWWKEAQFDPLLADQERGRITTSVQNDLYISPVTSADLGWWVCAAASAAGSFSGRVLLHTGRVKVPPGSASGRSGPTDDLVHLEEVRLLDGTSVRLSWKTSDRRPVDGFYICYIRRPAADGEATSAAPAVQKVTVLNGGADSYVLTGLRPGAAYEFFLVPFGGGREGRLSRLRRAQLPEAGEQSVGMGKFLGERSQGKFAGLCSRC
ncbi:roundabout homolog 3-like [Pollicipes pollicipes]|uniref:roundabout homolog 3-like n=1 Tax=Pollicipes pollicipes TaxID=41117 RepID=UPI00188504E3|nr:roundabout homolog 3-like [Pollicipes pollicipes]